MDGRTKGRMDKILQLDPRGAGTKNTKWQLDDTGRLVTSRSLFRLFFRGILSFILGKSFNFL